MTDGDLTGGRRGGLAVRHRPPPGLRWTVAALALVGCAFAGALMLSDRAPGLLVDVFGDTLSGLWERVDASERARSITDRDLPEEDFVVHVVVWAVVAGLAGLAIWSWTGLVVAALGVFGLSVVVELAQGRWSSTRAVEAIDVVANGVGVALGIVAAAAVIAGRGLIASVLGPRRHH